MGVSDATPAKTNTAGWSGASKIGGCGLGELERLGCIFFHGFIIFYE